MIMIMVMIIIIRLDLYRAKFVVDSRGAAEWVHNILTTVMTHIVVDKSTDNAEPRSIC